MAVVPIYTDQDFQKVSSLLNFRVHNLTTTERNTLGLSLGVDNKGLEVFDTSDLKPYYWGGSVWVSAGGSSIPIWGTIIGDINDQVDLQAEFALKANVADLALVATSGSYLDLSNRPTNLSDFINDVGYITGITGSDVITALGYIPADEDTTITATGNGITGGGDLSADRTIALDFAYLDSRYASAGSGVTSFNTRTGAITLLGSDVTTALGFTPVTNARLINTTGPLSGGGNLTADRTISISQSTTSTDGYLSSTDWNTFNNKQKALNWYFPEDYGAVGDGITNDAAAFQAMHDAMPAGGGRVQLSSKTYLINTQVNFSKAITMVGNGRTQSIISTTSNSIILFATTSNYAEWDDLQLINNAVSTPVSGSVAISATSGIALRMDNVIVNGFYNDLYVGQATALKITNSFFNGFVNYGIYIQNLVNADSGDESIIGCDFHGSPTVNSAAQIRYESGGGLKLVNCKFNTATSSFKTAVDLDCSIHNTVDLLVSNCSFENYSTSGIRLTSSTTNFHNIVITGNQFASGIGSTVDIDLSTCNTVTIVGNNFFGANSTDTAIKLTTVDRVVLLNTFSSAYTIPVVRSAVTNAIDLTKSWTAGTTPADTVYLGGNVGISTAGPLAQLDVSSGSYALLIGADSNLTSRTNATSKIGRIVSYPYTNANQLVGIAVTSNTVSDNTINWGGGSVAVNAATVHNFYTAANNNTATGTIRMVINSGGQVAIGTAASTTTSLLLPASTTGVSSLRIPAGTAPTSPVDGDIFEDSSHIYARIGGVTYQLDQQAGTGVSSVTGTTNRITSTGGTTPVIDISASYGGQSSITTLGTIGTGTWQGTAIADAYISSAATWNAKQDAISLTTTGTSGVATFIANTLNIPNYTYILPTASTSVLGGVKVDGTTITITGGVISATATGSVTSVSGTANRITSTGGTTPVIDIDAAYVGQASITTLGTIGTGIWQGSVIGSTYGGTGVNNGSSTITIGGSVTFSGAFTTTLTVTAGTSVTLPTSGTLVNSAVTTLSSLASIGTITTGVWNGTTIAIANGGTNATSFGTSNAIAYYDGTRLVTSGNLQWSNSNISLAIGGTSPSAGYYVNIAGGSTTRAPLVITAGTNRTSAISGGIENNGSNLFYSTSTPTRFILAKCLQGTATLNFGSTAAQTSSDLTITVTGAVVGDDVVLGVPNAAVNANSCYTAWVSATDTVTVRFNNYSSGAIDPASATFSVSVVRH